MVEILFTLAIILLAVLGLGIGLLFGKGPVQTSCGASDRLPKDRCEDCPLRRTAAEKVVAP